MKIIFPFFIFPLFTNSTKEQTFNIYLCQLLNCHNLEVYNYLPQFVFTFAGTTKIKNLDQNLGALAVKLAEKDLREISEAVPIEDVAGTHHYSETSEKVSWKFANTPPKDSKASA